MKEKLNLVRLHNVANAYGRRPSEYFPELTPLAAWQLDEACLLAGRRVEKNSNEGKDLFDGFADTGLAGAVKRGYRSAKQFVKRKMKIPESGVW